MKRTLSVILVCLSLTGIAQMKAYKPRGIFSAGIVVGEADAREALRATGGIAYKNYFAGIGVGLDGYGYSSIPLVADFRMEFGKKKLFFAYGNTGYHFPADRRDVDGPFMTSTFRGGIFTDFGVGVKLAIGKNHSVLWDAGMSYKEMSNTTAISYPCVQGPCDEDITKRSYKYARLVTKLSIQIGK